MSGLYNSIFGSNPVADGILSLLGLSKEKVGRFRDLWLEPDRVAVYTRNGGGNREHYGDEEASEECNCTGCTMSRLPAHPLYLDDRDDDFDCTYATVWFSFPPEHAEVLKELAAAQGPMPSGDERWERFLGALRKATP